MVIWLIGLSGSGKQQLEKKFLDLEKESPQTIFLDGDEVREIFIMKTSVEIIFKR